MTKDELFSLAIESRNNAYAPYSNFLVGCALTTNTGDVFSGCNFENLSFGATICAERNAIGAAINAGASQKNKTFINEIVVVSQTEKPAPPCGMCLQVLSEFSSNETKIHLANLSGIQGSYTLKDFLPRQFETIK